MIQPSSVPVKSWPPLSAWPGRATSRADELYIFIFTFLGAIHLLHIIKQAFLDENAEWTDVPVATLLAAAGFKPQTSQLVFRVLDGYQAALSPGEVQRGGIFLAHTTNRQVLPGEPGFPLRLVLTLEYGSAWVKWAGCIGVR
jgi:DMSO/TMAO reductase YedYZ molybdopterin-dependent catalytic subunit